MHEAFNKPANSQAFAPEALATFFTSPLIRGLGCVRPQGGSKAPVEVTLINRPQVGHLSSQVVPVPVELVVRLMGFRV